MAGVDAWKSLMGNLRGSSRNVSLRLTVGNAGDSLINLGAIKVFQNLQTRCQIVPSGMRAEADVCALVGGGYLRKGSLARHDVIRDAVRDSDQLVLMPQSLDGHHPVLELLRSQDILVLRDKVSYQNASGLGLRCGLALDHDSAFELTAPEVLGMSPDPVPAGWKYVVRRGLLRWHFMRARTKRRLDAWRTDGERFAPRLRLVHNDVSLISKFGTETVGQNVRSAQALLEVVGRYRSVRTDRLHVMIACIMMGVPVEVWANSYHKVWGVYEMSVQGFPDRERWVTWRG
jgi:hypothetical protein